MAGSGMSGSRVAAARVQQHEAAALSSLFVTAGVKQKSPRKASHQPGSGARPAGSPGSRASCRATMGTRATRNRLKRPDSAKPLRALREPLLVRVPRRPYSPPATRPALNATALVLRDMQACTANWRLGTCSVCEFFSCSGECPSGQVGS